MSENFQITDSGVILQSGVGIRNVIELHSGLLKCLDSDSERFTIDASALDKVDAALLQLLAGFVGDFCGQGGSVEWKASPEVTRAITVLGLTEDLKFH